MNPTVVVVEDDHDLSDLLGRGLRAEGFDVVLTATGAQLLDAAEASAPDAFVIDVGLPDSDGRDICQALRARGVLVRTGASSASTASAS